MAKRIRYPLSRSRSALNFPYPWGYSDYSGAQMFPHNTLVKQMRQAGNNVYWSGLMVYKDDVDPLDDQLRVPPIPPLDPPLVVNPRPNAALPYGNYENEPPPDPWTPPDD